MSNSVEDNNFESGLIEALQILPKVIVDLFSALNIILATIIHCSIDETLFPMPGSQ